MIGVRSSSQLDALRRVVRNEPAPVADPAWMLPAGGCGFLVAVLAWTLGGPGALLVFVAMVLGVAGAGAWCWRWFVVAGRWSPGECEMFDGRSKR